MTALDPKRTVGELVTERPARSRVFEAFHIDYCCGGQRPLEEACKEASVGTRRVLEALQNADAKHADPGERNWAEAGSAELIEHILSVHHQFLRRELPRLDGLIGKVVEAHGRKRPELRDVRTVFLALRQELQSHMNKEENVLFPAVVGAEAAGSSGPFDGPIAVMEHEHAAAGRALASLRGLTGDYTPPADACNTYRAMLDGLIELERDLHQHIHKENNILFPRFSTRSATAAVSR
jgi:regulator of cell morphogenesis and NO signaling